MEKSFEIDTVVVGPLMTNCYILSSDGECIIIDAGAEGQRIADFVRSQGFSVKHVLATHGHFDHVAGVKDVRSSLSCPFSIREEDMQIYGMSRDMSLRFTGKDIGDPEPPDSYIGDDEYTFGGSVLIPVHTPGHTPGSTSFLCEGSFFTGDTLFRGSIGRLDFGGSVDQMRATLERLKEMSDELAIYPGHGPATIMGEEKMNNPFLIEDRL